VIAWCNGLGQPTFIGSSARVFPIAMKASPLLRAWLRRLGELGVQFPASLGWLGPGWKPALRRARRFGARLSVRNHPRLGGASWPRLGSDAGWTEHLPELVTAFQSANCGFLVDWTPHFRRRFAGHPLKRLAIRVGPDTVRGEAVITETGLEGVIVYALSARLRDAIRVEGSATINVDLRPI
jgi:predicted flavoprotein YhiN